MKTNDTIAAISSAFTPAGIGIIRMSGPEAIGLASRIFKGKNKIENAKSHTVHYGYIVYENKVYDEVMLLIFRAPSSYTREDIIEIDCHGGPLVMKDILSLILSLGARMAEPGEFTRRAFLNGRIDLSQAESVMDVIHSSNERALKNSLKLLDGRLSGKIREFREEILYEIAFIESGLDDPEHFSFDGYADRLYQKCLSIEEKIRKLSDSYEEGSLLKNGIRTAIIGKPNVGKSSLLNMLSKKEKSIVTEIPGTTRDVVEDQIMLEGMQLTVMDTAGIRKTTDVVESIGVERSFDSIEKADLILYMLDASDEMDEMDDSISERIKNKKYIILINKTDQCKKEKIEDKKEQILRLGLDEEKVISFSVKEENGKDRLIQIIKHMFYSNEINDSDVYVTSLRHRELLNSANDSIRLVMESIQNGMPEDFYSIDLMDAYTSLGKIIGEEVEDDLVEKIFSEFCMGK